MENKKTGNLWKICVAIIVTAFLTCIITLAVSVKLLDNSENYYLKNAKANKLSLANVVENIKEGFDKKSIDEDEKTNFSSLENTLLNFKRVLEKKYIGEIDDKKLIEYAIKGYIAGLGDPYTQYLTKEEMQDFKEDTEGEYVGIGVYTTNDTEKNSIVVVRTIGDSPASRAGLLTGDIISKVNDIEYNGEKLSEAVKQMKGQAGTNVKITIIRNNQEMEFNITRENIKISHVSSEVIDNDIGYIKISSFEGGCAEEFQNRFNEIEDKNIRSLIIDLRYNGGGIVDEALKIADLMVPKDEILLITSDKENAEEITKAKNPEKIKMPIIVLVNEYSASASEILAGILKEDIDAKLIGVKTYGKGVIQTVYTLTDGSGLKITTNEYFTPKHNKINKIGIEPTLEVKLPEEYRYTSNIPRESDTQLKKAIEEIKNKGDE